MKMANARRIETPDTIRLDMTEKEATEVQHRVSGVPKVKQALDLVLPARHPGAVKSPHRTVPTGFRLLEPGEDIREGDWALIDVPGDWWSPVRRKLDTRVHVWYARRIEGTPDVGEGYRLVREGEEILETDEAWAYGRGPWETSESPAGTTLSSLYHPHRRKMTPMEKLPKAKAPKGWRFLEADEIVRPGDARAIFDVDHNRVTSWKPANIDYPGPRRADRDWYLDNLPRVYARKIKVEKVEVETSPVPEGYRLLVAGEVVEEGDICCFVSPWWKKVRESIGRVYDGSSCGCGYEGRHWWYARKIEEPVRYRLLVPGDVIREGDRWFGGNKWQDCRHTIGHTYKGSDGPVCRKMEDV
jgi:hypothetical protein